MIKGISQSKRNNAWHLKHLRVLKRNKVNRVARLLNYRLGTDQIKRNKKRAISLMEIQREKDLKNKFSFKKLFNLKKLSNA